ncbi:MAG TPA: tetratricopeptide repeat protein [Tepidisphaeraceae bacterium]|nr:tetratricopeptide repeat protein [Tepidisphaeraceae bacterium]
MGRAMQCAAFLAAVLLVVGCSPMKNKQKEQAKKEWNQARANVLFSLARDQYATGNFDKSRQTTEEALGMDPQNPGLRILSAKLAIEQGRLEQAEAELRMARAVAPKNAEADYLAGVIYQRWQKPETASDFYKSASEKAPAELAYIMARAEMLVLMDQPEQALSLLQSKVTYFEHSATIRDALGQLLVQQRRYKEGVDMLRQASILATDDLVIREHLALAMFYAGQYRESADALNRLMKKGDYADRADLLAALGECQLQLGQYREARATLETATQRDPASAGVWLSHAKAAIQLNDTKRAEVSLHKALAIAPDNSEAHLMLGYMRLRQNRLADALPAFRKASALDEGDTVSLCMVGYVLERLGKPDQAIQYYSKALRLKPNDEMAARFMASVNLNE